MLILLSIFNIYKIMEVEMDKLFKLKENNTSVRTEVVAGITTFMTMAYILAVNPSILSASGMDSNAILMATAIASAIGCFAMAFLANYPFALAPGLGLNAYFAYTVCGSMGYSWKVALFAVFVEGLVFIVLSLTNVKGFEANVRAEKTIAKAAAKLVYAFSNADVPKVNVITGEAYGSAYVAMNSKSVGADMVYAWSQASIGMMDANMAAKIMYADKPEVISEKASEYAALQTSAVAAAKRGYVDSIIAPADTRKYVIGAFEMLYSKKEDRPSKKHGTV